MLGILLNPYVLVALAGAIFATIGTRWFFKKDTTYVEDDPYELKWKVWFIFISILLLAALFIHRRW